MNSKPIIYKHKHEEASATWHYYYQGRTQKVHPKERAHIWTMTEWHDEQTRLLEATDEKMEACFQEYRAKMQKIVSERDFNYQPPPRPEDPWGAYWKPSTGKAPRKAIATSNSTGRVRRKWEEYERSGVQRLFQEEEDP